MTQQEKQEIIEAVLEALQTNSQSISQLTNVTDLMDSDMFEVAGGKRIIFANLVKNVMAKGVVNDLTTGGEGDALSAEMGKWLYTNLYTIFTQLGTYAFPNGKPQIDWGGGNPPVIPPCTVSKTIGTGLSSTGGDSDVAFGDPLEVSIAITDNLYIIDDDNVVVTMGGTDITSTAWNASTKKVTIAAVTGNVVINVPSLTYVSNGLVFHLDCKNRGGQTGHWIDRIGNKDFVLTNVTEADTGMVFDGSAKGVSSVENDSLQVSWDNATIEIVAYRDSTELNTPILGNTINGGVCATLFKTSGGTKLITFCTNKTDVSTSNLSVLFGVNDIVVSANKTSVKSNGSNIEWNSNNKDYTMTLSTVLSVGYVKYTETNEKYFTGVIKAIRVYGSTLTDAERAQNLAIDKKRFNLA